MLKILPSVETHKTKTEQRKERDQNYIAILNEGTKPGWWEIKETKIPTGVTTA